MADPKNPERPDAMPAAFANVARVRHTENEFFLDFGQMSLDHPGIASLVSLIVMTPQHTKRLVAALEDNVRKYEQTFGEIESKQPPTTPEVVQ